MTSSKNNFWSFLIIRQTGRHSNFWAPREGHVSHRVSHGPHRRRQRSGARKKLVVVRRKQERPAVGHEASGIATGWNRIPSGDLAELTWLL